jgi:HSP20 family molecular chaperone IbpA
MANPESAGARSGEADSVKEGPSFTPRVDIFENKDELLLVADMPGVRRDDLAIHVDKGQLTVEGRRDLAQGRATYRRSFLLPQGVDAGRIDAELVAGVLKLRLPKAEANKPRRIEVRAGLTLRRGGGARRAAAPNSPRPSKLRATRRRAALQESQCPSRSSGPGETKPAWPA